MLVYDKGNRDNEKDEGWVINWHLKYCDRSIRFKLLNTSTLHKKVLKNQHYIMRKKSDIRNYPK